MLKKFFTHSSEKEQKGAAVLALPKKESKKNSRFLVKSTNEGDISLEISGSENKKNLSRILELEAIIRTKDTEIEKLRKELEKLRSAMKGPIHAENFRFQSCKENVELDQSTSDIQIYKYPKDNPTSKKILQALTDNMYMRYLNNDQLSDIVSSMFLKPFKKDDTILKEGEIGDCLFLVEGDI
ncbi:hypothetical protein HZS_5949 [Henneguya salminicola]|nr:hypothetical protein HZS_5949 [Henneguya salminicola]